VRLRVYTCMCVCLCVCVCYFNDGFQKYFINLIMLRACSHSLSGSLKFAKSNVLAAASRASFASQSSANGVPVEVCSFTFAGCWREVNTCENLSCQNWPSLLAGAQ
jgi:hypothetical protein